MRTIFSEIERLQREAKKDPDKLNQLITLQQELNKLYAQEVVLNEVSFF